MKIGILTTFSDEVLPYMHYTVPINSRYTTLWGYDFILKRSRVKDRSHHWSKIQEALEIIFDYDYIWVLDADCIIQDNRQPIEQFIKLSPNAMLLICDDQPNGGYVNTGSMILKGGGKTNDLLRKWWKLGKQYGKLYDKYHEQDTLWQMMRNGDIKGNEYSIFSATAFNSIFKKHKDKEFVAHIMALPTAEKIKELQKIYKRVI